MLKFEQAFNKWHSTIFKQYIWYIKKATTMQCVLFVKRALGDYKKWKVWKQSGSNKIPGIFCIFQKAQLVCWKLLVLFVTEMETVFSLMLSLISTVTAIPLLKVKQIKKLLPIIRFPCSCLSKFLNSQQYKLSNLFLELKFSPHLEILDA